MGNVVVNLPYSELRAQFPCWKENGHELSQSCRAQTVSLKESMYQFALNQSHQNIQNICRRRKKKCNRKTMKQCLWFRLKCRKAPVQYVSITGRMFHNNREAMFNMLKIRWSTLPSQCSYSHLSDTYSSEKYYLSTSSAYIGVFFIAILFNTASLS
uniref:Transmembrane protein n=1 Tax=Angiostrongylus cantonensis TaxID=6313 RepID=A0A0K0D2N2_ANGCA